MKQNGFTVGATILAVVGVGLGVWGLLLSDARGALLLAAVAVLAVAFFMWRLGDQLGSFTYRGKRILKDGIRAEARVTSVEEASVAINGNPVLTVGLRVSPRNKEPFEVTVRQLVEKAKAPSVKVGADLDVRIDVKDRRRVVIAFAA